MATAQWTASFRFAQRPGALNWPTPALTPPNLYEHVDAVNRDVTELFNPYINFVKTAEPTSKAYQVAMAVRRQSHDLQRMMAKAEEQLIRQCEELRPLIKCFYDANRERRHWFLEGNILELSPREVKECLCPDLDWNKLVRHLANPPPDLDAARLARYMASLFTADEARRINLVKQSLYNERRADYDDENQEGAEPEKTGWLLETLRLMPGGQIHAWDLAVTYLTDVLRLASLGRESYVSLLFIMKMWPRKTLDFDGKAWRVGERDREPQPDFAALARRIGNAARGIVCNEDVLRGTRCRDSGFARACFHTHSKSILEFMRRRAHGQIRAKVILTVGTMLPAELTAEVLEYALLAEAMPLHLQAGELDDELGKQGSPNDWEITAVELSAVEEYGPEHCPALTELDRESWQRELARAEWRHAESREPMIDTAKL